MPVFTLLRKPFFDIVRFGVLAKRLHESIKSFAEHAPRVVEYSFDPRRNSLALAPAGSVMTIGLSKKGSSHSENQFDDREQD